MWPLCVSKPSRRCSPSEGSGQHDPLEPVQTSREHGRLKIKGKTFENVRVETSCCPCRPGRLTFAGRRIDRRSAMFTFTGRGRPRARSLSSDDVPLCDCPTCPPVQEVLVMFDAGTRPSFWVFDCRHANATCYVWVQSQDKDDLCIHFLSN